jgi:pilus assembly protein Flp/PilA
LEEIIVLQYIDKLIKKLKTSEKGQGMVEYALIIAFVAAIAIFVLNGGLRGAVSSAFDQASSAVNSAASVSASNGSTSGGNPGE